MAGLSALPRRSDWWRCEQPMRTDYFRHGTDRAAPTSAAGGSATRPALVAPGAVALVGLRQPKVPELTSGSRQSQEHQHESVLVAGSGSEMGVCTLRALLGLKGYRLRRTHCDDGPSRFYITRSREMQALRDVEAARAFAQQLGAPHA